MPKKVGILGGNGMLGRDLVSFFRQDTIFKKFEVTSINKENYETFIGTNFDFFINANGNSKRWWANQNPYEDFLASTSSVIKSIFDFPTKTYIYISSVDVYFRHDNPKHTLESKLIIPEKLEPYGMHKYLSEQIVKKYSSKFLILRPSAILGTSLKKGPVYDSTNGKPLFITKSSKLQFITAREVGNIIKALIKKNVGNEIINVGGIGSFPISKLNIYIKKEISFSPEAKTQKYEMNIGKLKHYFPELDSSENYLRYYCANI